MRRLALIARKTADMTTIDFQAAHDAKHGPDAEFVCRDDGGTKWFKFTCSYTDGTAQFSFELWALDGDDARRRLSLIATTGKVDGQLFHAIPA